MGAIAPEAVTYDCGVSLPLMSATLTIVAIGVLLPFSPLAHPLGFVPLPGIYLVFVAAATLVYLCLVEVGKRALLRDTK